MAKDLIRLSGLEPEVDKTIVFNGLRCLEKNCMKSYIIQMSRRLIQRTKIMKMMESNDLIPWIFWKK